LKTFFKVPRITPCFFAVDDKDGVGSRYAMSRHPGAHSVTTFFGITARQRGTTVRSLQWQK
jgi:hypothetical protein